MEYDFETQVDRTESGSSKWQSMLNKKPEVKGIVPFSVADMELKNPPEIIEGLIDFLKQEPILGYTDETDRYRNAVADWMQTQHDWTIEKEWIVTTPGVVAALSIALTALTKPNDSVLIMTPVYYPFRRVAQQLQLTILESPLIEQDLHYTIDFEDLKRKAQDPSCKVMILCSPHNPIGRVWTREELEKVAEICLENKVFILADEIHHDLIMPGYHHTVLASLSKEIAEHSLTCTSPSKTFNLAGMQVSNIIIPDPQVRQAFKEAKAARNMGHLNILSYEACTLAYTRCAGWRKAMIEHIAANDRLVRQVLSQRCPWIQASPLEGTYLIWLDLRSLQLSKEELEALMIRHDLFLDEGYIFGLGGDGFERINLACPSKTLEAGLDRLVAAIQEICGR